MGIRIPKKFAMLVLLVSGATCAGFAQSPPAAARTSGFVFYEAFEGDTNSAGQVMILSSSVTYRFNQHFSAGAGIPLYFDRASAATTGSTATTSTGIGNVFGVARAVWRTPVVNYGTALTGTAPSGSSQNGLSTGHATFDWDNRFDRRIGPLTPFVDGGVANSISDTRYFLRPFSTYGNLAHFEGGADVNLHRGLSVTLSAYDIVPWRTQTVVSRVVPGSGTGVGNLVAALHQRVFETAHETTGTATLTQDHGFIAGLSANPKPYLDLALGYSRSINYALNTVSFGVGVNLSALFGKNDKGT